MLGFAVTVLAIVCVGFGALAVARRWGAVELANFETLELLTAAALAGSSIWIAANWTFALTHTLTRPALLGLIAVFVAIAAVVIARAWPRLKSYEVGAFTGVQLAFGVPLLLWIVFILWRGTILPPLTHDVLAYHLPKAVMMIRAHGYEYFVAPDTRISHLPANYELLLADVLLASGSDRSTEWLGTTSFVFFLVACGAVAQRWWRSGGAAIPAMLVIATAPVLILHSGADKNDLLSGFFSVCALLWGARWAAEGGGLSLALLTTALTTGAGTKPQQAAILVGLLPFLLKRVVADVRKSRRALAYYGAIAIVAVLWFGVTGGAVYAYNAVHESSPLEVQIGASDSGRPTGVFQWGDWSNLWQFPYLLLTVPFSGVPSAVWVPWRHEYWFWPHYEIYFSHFGMPMSLLAVVLPYCVYKFRRAEGRPAERFVFSIAALIAFALTLPVQFRPFGFFGSFARYLLYMLPVIVCWTVGPLFRFVLPRRASLLTLTLIAAWFSFSAIRLGQRDQFAPWQFVRWAAENRGTRVAYFSPNRAASVVDRIAGPNDTIAVDGSFDTWIYPAFGRHLTRNIQFISSAQTISPHAQWVIVDRSWNAIWGHPGLTDMGKFWRYISMGRPTPADLAITKQLIRDPRFVLIYRDADLNQAVFWRRVPGQPVPRARLFRFRASAR
ncbi:MAG: hypothetical protein M3Q69_15560 [Acidobacteriota bacterium]|nr:hypothetical protein [Acidobacteriota bacterium]